MTTLTRKQLIQGAIFLMWVLIVSIYPGIAQAQDTSKTTMEIIYDHSTRQTVILDQPSSRITGIEFKTTRSQAAAPSSGKVNLTKGWDIFSDPLSFGQVNWSVSGRNLQVAFQLYGAKPNHEYTVGAHLFNEASPLTRPAVSAFGGWYVGEGSNSRDNRKAFAVAYDFGALRTNASGDGSAQFNLSIPPGAYSLQFTVRIGAVNTCRPDSGKTSGCAVVYRSGNRHAEHMETLVIQ